MSIWFQKITVDEVKGMARQGMAHHLDIEFTELGPDYLRATMPVDSRTQQPYGLLHGGASAALAETLGSVGANLCVDGSRYYCVGQEINANHLRPVREGRVTGTAKPVHLGRRSQVWDIRVEDESGRLSCVSRLTISVVEGRAPAIGDGGRR